MNRKQPPEHTVRNRRRIRQGECAIGLLFALGVCGHAAAHTPDALDQSVPVDQSLQVFAKGHGDISIAYQNTLVDGMLLDRNTTLPIGTVRIRAVDLDLDYYFTDRWAVHLGIPFVSNRYSGPDPHCPTTTPPQCANQPVLSPQHPESQFLDDGRFHSTWQDWNLGVSYHTNIGNYYLTPSITAYIPSHNYTFFANAAAGQDIWQLELAIDLAHQFDFSNLYYRIGYGYVFTERTLGTSVSHHKLDLELGYFLNPQFSIRAFGIGRVGHGYAAADLLPLTNGQTNDFWYHHDQISEHNYFGVGVGFDYRFADKYTLSSSVQRLVWGESVFDFKYAFETRLTREF